MCTRRYAGPFPTRNLIRSQADKRDTGIFHQARLPPAYVFLLPLQHDRGPDQGRVKLTRRPSTSRNEVRRQCMNTFAVLAGLEEASVI